MKVIKKAKSYKVTCPRCLSVLEFELNEVKLRNEWSYTSSGGVTCPVCKGAVIVGEYRTGSGVVEMHDKVTAYYEDQGEGLCVNVTEVSNGK